MGIGNMEPGLVGTSTKSFAITPHDSTNFTLDCRYIFCGAAGNVALVNIDDAVVTYAVLAGAYILCAAKRVNATGTTATGLVGHR